MKKLVHIVLSISVLCFVGGSVTHAQQIVSIAQLKEQIKQFEMVARDANTPAPVKSINRNFLMERRSQLRTLLQYQVDSLRKYQINYQSHFSAKESQVVTDSIRSLEKELQTLKESMPLIGRAITSPSVMVQPVSTGTTVNPEAPDTRGANMGGRTKLSLTSLSIPQSNPITSVEYPRAAGNGGRGTNWDSSTATSGGVPLPAPSVRAPEPQGGPSCPSCLPGDPPNEKKDFIISARTGESKGKKKFGLHDNARIIITEKNPFLYEYRVTLKDKPILEPAIAEFFGNFPLFTDTLKPKTGAGGAAAAAGLQDFTSSCPQLGERFPLETNTLFSLWQALEAADSSGPGAASLRNQYIAEKNTYEGIAQQVEQAKRTLYDQNASCPNLCATATSIRSTLQNYRPDLQQLSNDINLFKSRADSFQLGVQDLEAKVRNSSPQLPNNCFTLIDQLRTLASGYKDTANTFEGGVQKITNGKKTFDAIVKTINNVFSNPNAFYQVYTRGEYGTPTDVEITVERKDLTKDDTTFAKVGEVETINFGGGPRFAIAGGIVVSPLETVNFKRVPAIVGGRSTTIVGKDEGSNTRVLPMLMLHGRLMEGRGAISGLHMSLGITAKPNDTGTNVEFLIGPSLSFIEERLFLTFGGYAGRRKQLEGNLVLGQELPTGFTDEIPTSNHLVWKPGVALTYKFK